MPACAGFSSRIRQRDREGRPARLGCSHPPLFLEISSPRIARRGTALFGRLRRCSTPERARIPDLPRGRSPAPTRIRKRAVRRRRSRSSRGFDPPAGRSRRDPNDDEVVYHTPESYDNGALKVLVETGKLTPDSLATLLLRKHDWHDYEGVKWLLEHGADPNRMTRWRRTAFYQAVQRDNALAIVEVSLEHGADPTLAVHGESAVTLAARRGRGDVLELFERRGIPIELHGADRLIAACARNDAEGVRTLAGREPGVAGELRAEGGKLLAEFAGVGNTDGVRRLLDLGLDVAARFREGDGYWDVARDSTALHVAAWRARHSTVKLLIERGAAIDVLDGKGRTPLALAVRACVHSYWTDRRSPESVEALLRAGALVDGVDFPSGYAEVDELLRRYGKG